MNSLLQQKYRANFQRNNKQKNKLSINKRLLISPQRKMNNKNLKSPFNQNNNIKKIKAIMMMTTTKTPTKI